MPFRSKAQVAKFAQMVKDGKISQETFQIWLGDTPDVGDLPKRVGHKHLKIRKVKKI